MPSSLSSSSPTNSSFRMGISSRILFMQVYMNEIWEFNQRNIHDLMIWVITCLWLHFVSHASRISSSYLSLIEIQIVVYTICISAGVNKILMSVDNLTLTSFFVPSFSIRSNTSSNGILGNRRWAQCSKYRMMICRSLACNNTNLIITMSYPFNMWLYSIVVKASCPVVNFKDHVG